MVFCGNERQGVEFLHSAQLDSTLQPNSNYDNLDIPIFLATKILRLGRTMTRLWAAQSSNKVHQTSVELLVSNTFPSYDHSSFSTCTNLM